MRQTTIFTLLIAAAMSVALFYLKYEVTDLEAELDLMNRGILADQEEVHVLKAEWSHLNDVTRIKVLADRYLNMQPTDPEQIKIEDDIPLMSFEPGDRPQGELPDDKKNISFKPTDGGTER